MIDLTREENIGRALKNRSRIDEAVKVQDRIRKKSGDWSGEDAIKKLRKN